MELPIKNFQKIHQILSKLFGQIDDDLIKQITETGRTTNLSTGDFLIKQGEKDNSLFILISGRLRAIADQMDGTSHILGDIGEGEPIGEFALFTGEPRSASVVAIRKSIVLEIPENDYLNLVARFPHFASTITNFVIKRLRRNNLQQHLEVPPKNIAVINLQAENDISPWTDAIQAQFESKEIPINVYHFDSEIRNQESIFETLEQHEGLNFMVCSENDLEWSYDCITYADLVIIATDFYADSDIYKIEAHLNLYSKSILNKKNYLLLLHPENAKFPENTNRWFTNRKIDLHIHYRKNHGPDIRRFFRILTNQAVGIVLGGGGAKGFAHIGVIKAMMEKGIEIDFLGGTSAGALYGMCMTYFDFDFDKINYYSKDSAQKRLTSNDYTIPILSIMSGKKMSDYLRKMLGSAHMEDIWVNTYCISTNYSSASIKIHNRGLAWKQIEASIAIPGIYPPVVIDRQLHVDGGVVDNLPIESMYNYPVKHILAISLTSLITRKTEYENTPSAREILWDKVTGKKRFRIPGLSSILINSLTLNSRQKQELKKSGVAVYLEMNLPGIGLMDDRKWEKITEKGYIQMKEHLENVSEEERFW